MNSIWRFSKGCPEMNTLIHSTVILSILFLISKLMGPLKSIFIAHQFGVSRSLDAYFVAQGIIDVVLAIFSFVVIILSVPVFIEREMKKEAGNNYKNTISCFVNQSIIFSLFLSLIFFLLSPVIGSWIPGFSGPERQQTLSYFLRINGLILLFSLPVPVMTGFFYSKNSFILPSLTNLFPIVGALASIALLSRLLEVYAIPAGILFGTAIAFLILLCIYVKGNRLLPFHVMDFSIIRSMKNYLIPAMIFSCGGNFNGMVDQMITSGIKDGGVSILSYAQFVMMMPFTIITLPILTTIFPELSRAMALKDMVSMTGLISKAFLVITTCLLPITIALFFYRTTLLGLLLHHGRFEFHFIKETSGVLLGYLPGILFLSFNNLFQRLFFIRHQFSFLMWMTLATSFLNLIFDLWLSKYFSVAGIALSSSLIEIIYFIPMLFFLRGMFVSIFYQLQKWLFPIMISSGCLTLTLAAASYFYPISLAASRLEILSVFIFQFGLGATVYFSVLFLGLRSHQGKRRNHG
jgi:putative peptidoglycan lipid II flippase